STLFYKGRPLGLRRSGRRAGKEAEDAAFALERSLGSRRSLGQQPKPRGHAVVRARSRTRDGPGRLGRCVLSPGADGRPCYRICAVGTTFCYSLPRSMDDIHISRELYQAVERGELSRGFLEELQAEHLRARCPHCRAEADAY